MHHPALVKRVHRTKLGFAVDAEVEADIRIPLRTAYVQLLFGVADRQQERAPAGRHRNLRVDPERHHDLAAAIVQMAEVREVNIVRDLDAVTALGQLVEKGATVGEGLPIQHRCSGRRSRSVHGQPVQHRGKLPALGVHRRELWIRPIAHGEIEADLPLRRRRIVSVGGCGRGMIEIDGRRRAERVLSGVEQSRRLQRRARLPCQPHGRIHALV